MDTDMERLKSTMLLRYILPCCLMLLLTTCITEYEPKGITGTADILVVEGAVLFPEGTKVKLSRTKELNDKKDYKVVSGAQVAVITESGEIIAYAEELDDTGEYYVENMPEFSSDAKYALDIVIDGKHYQSLFEKALVTPEIDEVSWELKKGGHEVDILLSTHDPEQKVNYFLWKYEENWEIKMEYFAGMRYDFDQGKVIKLDLGSSNNTYYCWNRSNSTILILGENNKLENGIIKNKVVHNVKSGTKKFSELYSILVKQYAISFEAYTYFNNLHTNISESGSLFAPQPTEMEGNIKCITDSSEPVIGYVYFSTEQSERIFIHASEAPLMKEIKDCSLIPGPDIDRRYPEYAYYAGWGVISKIEGTDMYDYRLLDCVDCTRFGFKTKPDFWPNNHL